MKSKKGWYHEPKRHSLAAYGVKTKKEKDYVSGFWTEPKRYDRSLGDVPDYFIDEKGEMYITKPYDYLSNKYLMPRFLAKKYNFRYEDRGDGVIGVNKDILDEIGYTYRKR